MNARFPRSPDKTLSTDFQVVDLDAVLERSHERQAATASELQEVLYSTGIAAILLDADLNVLLFTPAAANLLGIIAGDIGRPLSNRNSSALDESLLSDASRVQQTRDPIECEILAESGFWYLRRVLPNRADSSEIDGVVIAFTDITLEKKATAALEQANLQAEATAAAHALLLSTASHDLRQPLQALVLLQELLAKVVVGDDARRLVGRFDQALCGMSSMLNTLLDISQIDAGAVRAEFETFRIDAVLDRVTTELACQADARRIVVHVVPCSLLVRSDPRLLEQMIRNLLANALKYSRCDRVIVGCRRHNDRLSIEVWNDGVGITADQLQDIFEERYPLDNPTQDFCFERSANLSVVKQLGNLMDHAVTARSKLGRGSVFIIEVERSTGRVPVNAIGGTPCSSARQLGEASVAAPVIYVVDADSEVRHAFGSMLESNGHVVEGFGSAEEFIEAFRPGRNACLLIDTNLPGMSGLDLLKFLRGSGHSMSAIMVTGHSDVPLAVEAMKAGVTDFLEKPVRGADLLAGVERALQLSRDAGRATVWRKDAVDHLACLTTRQHQIMEMVLAGHPSKNIAVDLGISQRTVENHRASIMKKAGVRSLPALARLALAAAGTLGAHQSLTAIAEVLTI